MAIVFEKTWQYDINRAASDNSTVIGLSRSWVWWLKAFLRGEQGGATLGLWTCYYSCDSVTAGTANDGVDRWGGGVGVYDGTKIVRAAAGVAHSWYVLKSPVFSTPAGNQTYYCIIDFSGNADSTPLNLVFSKAAPTGGTTTARPTATDEWTHTANTQLNDNTTTVNKFHGGLTTDGMWYALASKTGGGCIYLGSMFQIMAETRTVNLYPAITMISYNAAVPGPFVSNGSAGGITNSSSTPWKGRFFDGSAVTSSMAVIRFLDPNTNGPVESFNTNALDFEDGAIPDLPMYIYDGSTNKRSIRGRLIDIRWAAAGATQSTTDPQSGSPDSFIAGHCWFPGNAAPQI